MNEKNTHPNKRQLIYIPIIHTQADMGGLGDSVQKRGFKQMGVQSWKRKVRRTEELWNRIEKTLEQLDLPYDRVRLYQDGLPVCGNETDIVKDLAESGSRNHRLLLRLMEKGAILMGTESPELLLQEYQEIKRIMARNASGEGSFQSHQDQPVSEVLLKKRDKFIAQRIYQTLGPGEIGILFLGMLHHLENDLLGDIHLLKPIEISNIR